MSGICPVSRWGRRRSVRRQKDPKVGSAAVAVHRPPQEPYSRGAQKHGRSGRVEEAASTL
jgi:hypothetical protein